MANITVERRKHNRVKFETVVDLKLPSDAGRFISRGRVKDISLGGLKFESCQELSTNELLVSFCNGSFLDGSEIECRVIRAVKDKLSYIYGVEFKKLNLLDKAKIWYKTTAA
ncbi:MAG: hypothetical protein A2231_11085 [Candidatus Firestonebacteria bacterium RIFOXYA2_FULL_40_8]|nr:MAG: hypothetical protein A2231_11085 [Candidatus Firestonebacteria bacterium RIFOXYA2_FULL_40_8]